MRKFLSALVAGLVLLVGCDFDDGIELDSERFVYFLGRVDKQPLPAVLRQSDVEEVVVTGGQFELSSTKVGRYSFSYTLETTAGGSVSTATVTNSGSWVPKGEFIALHSDQDDSVRDVQLQGTSFDSANISFLQEGVLFVFLWERALST